MLENKVVVVTGGGRGLGLAMVDAVIREGGIPVVADLNPGELSDSPRPNAHFIACDVTSSNDVANVVEQAVAKHGSVDGLVNNAGIGITGPFLDLTESQFEAMVDVNLRGTLLFMQAVIRQMLAQASGGSVVNISSVGGLVGTPEFALYSMSKHGVIGLTKSVALEFAKEEVRVNAVCPGPVWTSMIQAAAVQQYGTDSPEKVAEIQHVPRGRLGTPEEVAELVVWLLSDRSKNCHGSSFTTDGGYSAQ